MTAHAAKPRPGLAILAIPNQLSPAGPLRQMAQLRISCLVCLDAAALVPLAERYGPDVVVIHHRFSTGVRSLVNTMQIRCAAPALVIVPSSAERWETGADGLVFADRPLAPQVAALVPTLLDPSPSDSANPSTWGPLLLDARSRRAFWRQREIRLTTQQFRAMSLLCQARGGVVSVEALSTHLYGERVGADRQRVVAHIRRVRRLIEVDSARPAFLLTVRGEGFRLADLDDATATAAPESA
jgi:DNA-binding response OmpR family regulator